MVERAIFWVNEFFDVGDLNDAFGLLVLMVLGAFLLLVLGLCKAAKKEPEQ